ncbi:hypothetical protein OAF54_03545 [bacterium]|nr:hypothetical protein [bacterium]
MRRETALKNVRDAVTELRAHLKREKRLGNEPSFDTGMYLSNVVHDEIGGHLYTSSYIRDILNGRVQCGNLRMMPVIFRELDLEWDEYRRFYE